MNEKTIEAAAKNSAENFTSLMHKHRADIISAIQKNDEAGEKRMTITHKLILNLDNKTMNDKLSFSVATSSETGLTPLPNPEQPELFEEK